MTGSVGRRLWLSLISQRSLTSSAESVTDSDPNWFDYIAVYTLQTVTIRAPIILYDTTDSLTVELTDESRSGSCLLLLVKSTHLKYNDNAQGVSAIPTAVPVVWTPALPDMRLQLYALAYAHWALRQW